MANLFFLEKMPRKDHVIIGRVRMTTYTMKVVIEDVVFSNDPPHGFSSNACRDVSPPPCPSGLLVYFTNPCASTQATTLTLPNPWCVDNAYQVALGRGASNFQEANTTKSYCLGFTATTPPQAIQYVLPAYTGTGDNYSQTYAFSAALGSRTTADASGDPTLSVGAWTVTVSASGGFQLVQRVPSGTGAYIVLSITTAAAPIQSLYVTRSDGVQNENLRAFMDYLDGSYFSASHLPSGSSYLSGSHGSKLPSSLHHSSGITKKTLGTGSIVGITIGAVAFVVAVSVGGYYLARHVKQRKSKPV